MASTITPVRPGARPEHVEAVQGLRRSSAASPHRVVSRTGRGSRADQRRTAIRDSLGR